MRAALIFVLCASAGFADPKPGDEGTPEYAKANELVKQLGQSRFAIREEAGKKLVEMGPAAVPALRAGSKASDEEVRARCAAVLTQIRAAELDRRVAAYLADAAGERVHNFPLLAEWEKVTGKPDAGSRKLFADMFRRGGDVLELAAANPKAAAEAVQAKCITLLAEVQDGHEQRRVAPDQLALLFFAHLRTKGRPAAFGRADHPAHLLINPGVPEGVKAKDTGPAFRRLLAAWMDSQPTDEDASRQFFAFALWAAPFPEAVPALAQMAKDRKAPAQHVRAVAIEALGRVGDDRAKAALADLVENADVLVSGSRGQCRAGDLALANWLTASSGKPADYGFGNPFTLTVRAAERGPLVSLTVRYFMDAAARDAAVKKWKSEAAK